MSRSVRILLIVLAVVGVLVVAVAAAGLFVVRRPFPKTAGTLEVAGLQGQVDVYRDEYGVPHIYADNEHDLFFAQGYVHAQDRFWQMEWWRHIGQGRLAEIAGEPLVETDTFIRTVGWNRMAENSLAYYEQEMPEYIAILEAYSDGVNAYLDENRDNFSLNQTVLGLAGEPWEIEPWEPVDTVSWLVVMSWDLGGNWSSERTRARMNQALGEEMTADLLPLYPFDRRPVIAPTDELRNRELLEGVESMIGSNGYVAWDRLNTDIIGEVPELALASSFADVGSNDWVIAGEHTATGMPLLADDPHLGIQMPSIWYEVHLNAPGWNVTGFSFAGAPGVVIGHNDRIAWGVTNVGPDVQDLYIERVNPDNPLQYEYQGEWHDMAVFDEVIGVNGGDEVTVQVRQTRHGPIINDVVDGEEDVLALRWTVQEPVRSGAALLRLDQAQNFEEFREALRFFDAPSQNFVYADVEGNIGYQTPGNIPIRRNGNGTVPVPGWTDEYEWEGYIPFDQLPTLFNPEKGYIVTANNALVDPDYPYLIGLYWASGDRAERITNMIEQAIAAGDVTAADIAEIHMDGKSLLAESFLPLFEGLESEDQQVQEALERVRGWDLQTSPDSVGAALFEIFFMHLAEDALGDELGEVADSYLGTSGPQRIFFHSLARSPEAAWWDDVNTEAVEGYEQIMLQAMADTVAWFEERQGGDMDDWAWGNIHQAIFVSDPLGQSGIGVVEQIFNRGPYPVAGTGSAVNANSWGWSDPAIVRGHPSLRMIVDLSDFDQSQGIHSTGQSGHAFHEHYDDMIPMWQTGEYHPMWFSEAVVQEKVDDHLILVPQAAE